MSQWTARDSAQLYNIARWGDGYFGVGENGDVQVCDPGTGFTANFPDIQRQLQGKGLNLPVLVRFPHILHHRVSTLVNSFSQAIEEESYAGRFTPIYPIKVNQQFRVVKELITGQQKVLDGHTGLEAGSKPELMAVLAIATPGKSTIVCNGYKDRDYIRLALVGQRLGHRVYIVLEKSTELLEVLAIARELGVTPRIGVRARLSTIGKGNWQDTGGPKSKFGLSASEILHTIALLKEHGQLESFQLLHFHLGSQIANIQDIQIGLREAARFYAELCLLGLPIDIVDVGGGLGVDYEGTASRSSCSINYSMSEYAKRVVHAFREAAAINELKEPHIFSESGRAMTAHHAVLMTNIIGIEHQEVHELVAPDDSSQPLTHNIWHNYQTLQEQPRNLIEIYHDLVAFTSDINQAFTQGQISLEERAQNEQILRATAYQLMARLNPSKKPHRVILDELNEQMADKLFGNFSLFQSLPDVWGVEQIFPIIPLHHLNQEPTRRGVIRDITCDSDGRIDQYVDGEGLEATLPYPPIQAEGSLLGFFLVGAYQEILGDLHNLFGDTNAVDVTFNEQGEAEVTHWQRGDSVSRVLQYVNFDPSALLQSFEQQVTASELNQAEHDAFISWLKNGLDDTTYLG